MLLEASSHGLGYPACRVQTKGKEPNIMKKIVSLLLAAMMLFGATACGSQEPAAPTLKEGVTLQSIVDSISEEYEFSMPGALDETMLTDLLGINTDDVEDYAGNITMVMVSADNLIAVKAKEGKLETVQKALEDRLAFVNQSFQQYLPEQYSKAQAGKVFTVGDYAFLVIMGRMDHDPAAEVAEIEEKIKGNFDNVA